MADNAFKEAVENTPDIKDHYCPGLQAVKGSERKMISPEDTKKLSGSVDIDSALKAHNPNEARWDYTIGYEDKAYFVEVHPANTSEVDTVIKKVEWLKDWLNKKASKLKSIGQPPYYWIPSGSYSILKGSPQEKKLSQNGIKIQSNLKLPPKQ